MTASKHGEFLAKQKTAAHDFSESIGLIFRKPAILDGYFSTVHKHITGQAKDIRRPLLAALCIVVLQTY